MSSGVLTVVAIIRVQPDHLEEIGAGLRGLIEPTLQEEGCINYDLHQDREDPTLFVFHENWTSEELLDRHLESDHIKAFQAIADGKLEADVRRMDKI